MSVDHQIFAAWDASYVLGALTPEDRRAYEAHLEECTRCRASVAELASMPGLLARARPEVEAWDAPELDAGPPADLVNLVTQRHERNRRRLRNRVIHRGDRRWRPRSRSPSRCLWRSSVHPRRAPARTLALTPVATTSLTATVGLSPVAWGTSIDMTCEYPAVSGWGGTDGPWTYSLVVTDDAGNASQVSTWTAVPGKTIHLDAATAVPLDQIASIEVMSAGGQAILTGSLEG